MVLCPPGVPKTDLAAIAKYAEVQAIVLDADELIPDFAGSTPVYRIASAAPAKQTHQEGRETEWVLLTSGTTGIPKMVVHRLASLLGPIDPAEHLENDVVWGTFYDIRRYAGLQTFLRSFLGNGSLLLSDQHESPADHLIRLATNSVTHMNGTPSHWRKAFMCREARGIMPRYVRGASSNPSAARGSAAPICFGDARCRTKKRNCSRPTCASKARQSETGRSRAVSSEAGVEPVAAIRRRFHENKLRASGAALRCTRRSTTGSNRNGDERWTSLQSSRRKK